MQVVASIQRPYSCLRFLTSKPIVRSPIRVSSYFKLSWDSLSKQYCSRNNVIGFSTVFCRKYAQASTQKQKTSQSQASKKPTPTPTKPKPKKVIKHRKKKLKIILIENIPKIGEKGEHIEVSKGFARNYLFPKRLAVYDTPENTKLYEEWTKKIDYEKKEKAKMLEKAKKRISKIVVEVKRHEVSPGVLHSNVTPQVIAEKLFKQHRIELDPSQIKLSTPLSTFGRHEVLVDLGGVEGILTVVIVKR